MTGTPHYFYIQESRWEAIHSWTENDLFYDDFFMINKKTTSL
jgi:hypothetical protein